MSQCTPIVRKSISLQTKRKRAILFRSASSVDPASALREMKPIFHAPDRSKQARQQRSGEEQERENEDAFSAAPPTDRLTAA